MAAVVAGLRFRDARRTGLSVILHRSPNLAPGVYTGHITVSDKNSPAQSDSYSRPDSPANTLSPRFSFRNRRNSDIDSGRSGPASPNGNRHKPGTGTLNMDNPDIHHLRRQLADGDQLRNVDFDFCQHNRFSRRPILRLGKCCLCECLEQPAIHFCSAERRRRTVGAGNVGVDRRSHFGRLSWKRSRGSQSMTLFNASSTASHLFGKCICLWRCRMAFGKPSERHSERRCNYDSGGRGLQRSLGRSAKRGR